MKHFAMTLVAGLSLIAGAVNANTYLNPAIGNIGLYGSDFYGETENNVVSAAGGWYEYDNFMDAGSRWLSVSPSNEKVYVRSTRSGSGQLLVDFSNSVGTRYNVRIDNCSSVATLAEKVASLTTPAGNFSDVMRLEFNNRCREGGVENAWFAKGVGLVQWQNKIYIAPNMRVAAHVKSLQGAKVGKAFYPALKGLELTGEIASTPVVLSNSAPRTLNARFALVNTTGADLPYWASRGGLIQATLLNENGAVVNPYLDTGIYPADVLMNALKAGKVFEGTLRLPLQDSNGQALIAGSYQLRLRFKGNLSLPDANDTPVASPSVLLPVNVVSQ